MGPAGGPYRVVRDFSSHNTFTWTPLQEGSQTIVVKAKEGFAATDTSSASLGYTVTPLVTGSSAVVAGTANPLVALYAAPPCGSGVIVLRFRAVGDSSWSYTNPLPCRPGVTRNFLVAGMRANTAYIMQHLITSSSEITQSAPATYTTGSAPSSVSLLPVSVPVAPTSPSDQLHNLVVHMLPLPRPGVADPFATDLSGRLVWYYDPSRPACPT